MQRKDEGEKKKDEKKEINWKKIKRKSNVNKKDKSQNSLNKSQVDWSKYFNTSESILSVEKGEKSDSELSTSKDSITTSNNELNTSSSEITTSNDNAIIPRTTSISNDNIKVSFKKSLEKSSGSLNLKLEKGVVWPTHIRKDSKDRIQQIQSEEKKNFGSQNAVKFFLNKKKYDFESIEITRLNNTPLISIIDSVIPLVFNSDHQELEKKLILLNKSDIENNSHLIQEILTRKFCAEKFSLDKQIDDITLYQYALREGDVKVAALIKSYMIELEGGREILYHQHEKQLPVQKSFFYSDKLPFGLMYEYEGIAIGEKFNDALEQLFIAMNYPSLYKINHEYYQNALDTDKIRKLEAIDHFNTFLEKPYFKKNLITQGPRFEFGLLTYLLHLYNSNCKKWDNHTRSLFMINVYGNFQRYLAKCDQKFICNNNSELLKKCFSENSLLGKEFFVGLKGEYISSKNDFLLTENFDISELYLEMKKYLKIKQKELSSLKTFENNNSNNDDDFIVFEIVEENKSNTKPRIRSFTR